MKEIKTLGEAWKVMQGHGLEAGWCASNCDHFALARVLSKQDDTIKELLEACKASFVVVSGMRGTYPELYQALKGIVSKAEKGGLS